MIILATRCARSSSRQVRTKLCSRLCCNFSFRRPSRRDFAQPRPVKGRRWDFVGFARGVLPHDDFVGGWEFLGALHWATPPVHWKCKDDITGKSCVEYIRVRKYSGCLRKRNSLGSEQISITRVFPSFVHCWKKKKKLEPKRFFEAQTTGSSGNWYVKKMVTENISLPREELMRNRRKILRPRVYPYIHRVARETATRPDVNHQYDYARIS